MLPLYSKRLNHRSLVLQAARSCYRYRLHRRWHRRNTLLLSDSLPCASHRFRLDYANHRLHLPGPLRRSVRYAKYSPFGECQLGPKEASWVNRMLEERLGFSPPRIRPGLPRNDYRNIPHRVCGLHPFDLHIISGHQHWKGP